ncbi:hypothetical protein U1Q18_033378 [Sarracenia purpurea var. burkii]
MQSRTRKRATARSNRDKSTASIPPLICYTTPGDKSSDINGVDAAVVAKELCYRGAGKRPWGKCAAKIQRPGRKCRVRPETFDTAEDTANNHCSGFFPTACPLLFLSTHVKKPNDMGNRSGDLDSANQEKGETICLGIYPPPTRKRRNQLLGDLDSADQEKRETICSGT